MHHQLDLLLFQNRPHGRHVSEAGFVEGNRGRDRTAVPIDKVVEHGRPMPGIDQLPHAMAPDVTSPAHNEYFHWTRLVLIFPG